MLLGLDLAPRKCGWCAGDGRSVPEVGGFRILSDLEDLAGVLEETRVNLVPILQRFKPTAVMIECPILPANRQRGAGGPVVGSLAQRRAQFAQNGFAEWLIVSSGIECFEDDLWAIKDALTGNKFATKDDMVSMALRLGVKLPNVLADGREDAADAVGAWLLLLRGHDKSLAAEWDRRLYGSRGALL